MRLLRRLWYFLHRSQYTRALAEEIELHRQMVEDQQRREGFAATDARNAARRTMGNETLAAEDARHIWMSAWPGSVVQDLRYAARSLRNQPGFTALALLALTLGTGLNAALFTFYNAIAFRPWPVRDPDRMVTLNAFSAPLQRYAGFSFAEYRYLSAHTRALEGLFLERSYDVGLDHPADTPASLAHFVTGNYFAVLGVRMEQGRGFADNEDFPAQPRAVAVLSHATWQTRYGGDPQLVGREIRVNDVPFTVVGIAPKDFTGTSQQRYDLWLPLASLPVARPNDTVARALLTEPNWCCSSVAGRLSRGATREHAQAELSTLAGQFAVSIGEQPQDVVVRDTAILSQPSSNNNDKGNRTLRVIPLLMGAAGAILLLACANVSNLLLARAAARQREIAVRVSIGAGRPRIVRQLLTESLLLAVLAGGLSIFLVAALVSTVETQGSLRVAPDQRVLAYTFILALFSAVAFGLAPALRGTRVSVSEAMKLQSTHASPRFPLRAVLLGFQVAVSVTLLVGAGLLARSLYRAHFIDLGFTTAGLTTISVDLPANSYDEARTRVFFDDLAGQVRQLAGSEGVGLAVTPPLGNSTWRTGFRLDAQAARDTIVLMQWVDAGYFEILHIPVVAGRNFIPGDRVRRNILINESMARRYWPGKNAVGEGILQGRERREIVGVVRDAQIYGLGEVEPIYFEPYAGGAHGVGQHAVLIVPAAIAPAAVDIVRGADSHALVTPSSLDHQLDFALQPARLGASIAAGLGLLALLLATIGVYGVISYSVEQRRREIGVRMALGARASEIVRLIVAHNARTVLCGLAVGLALSLALSKALEGYLYAVSRFDPLAYTGVLLILLAAGIIASAIPAHRATDPLEALRHD